jgi:hypothetical protein
MKRKLLPLVLLSFVIAHAQDYQPLQLTGFNADVVANGVGTSISSTSTSFDNADYDLMAANYQLNASTTPPAYALPVSGLVSSATMPGLTYQLAPYAGNNALQLPNMGNSGTLTLSSGVSATTLYVLAASGSGIGALSGTIHFSDASTQAIAPADIPDWFFSNALPVEISSFGRVNRLTDVVENPTGGDPRLYRLTIPIAAANQTKTIASIDFSKTSSAEGTINIMAVSAQLLGTCPAPTDLAISDVTFTSATLTWNSPVILPGDGYQYYISSGGTAPTAGTLPSGTTPSAPVLLNGLVTGVNYCVWVRSACSGTETGPWSQSTCFTPGEVSQSDPNDIPTLYATSVDVTTTTSCPGTLSIVVPDGYHITSVATSYQMQTALNGWMSEQRSLLACPTSGLSEAAVTSGVGSSGGTYTYDRSGINIANNLSGTVNFELRAWRTYGSTGCNTDYNRVLAGSWTVTATLAPGLAAPQFDGNAFVLFPNPAKDNFTVNCATGIREIALYNLLGQEMARIQGGNQNSLVVPVKSLPDGNYLVKVSTDTGQQTKKLIKG